jgi:hypothetical protein
MSDCVKVCTGGVLRLRVGCVWLRVWAALGVGGGLGGRHECLG